MWLLKCSRNKTVTPHIGAAKSCFFFFSVFRSINYLHAIAWQLCTVFGYVRYLFPSFTLFFFFCLSSPLIFPFFSINDMEVLWPLFILWAFPVLECVRKFKVLAQSHALGLNLHSSFTLFWDFVILCCLCLQTV